MFRNVLQFIFDISKLALQKYLMNSYQCNTIYDYKYNINHKTDRKNDGTRIFYLKKQLRKLYMWFISLLFL